VAQQRPSVPSGATFPAGAPVPLPDEDSRVDADGLAEGARNYYLVAQKAARRHAAPFALDRVQKLRGLTHHITQAEAKSL
jgi:hypothetical protein